KASGGALYLLLATEPDEQFAELVEVSLYPCNWSNARAWSNMRDCLLRFALREGLPVTRCKG
ncbi:MAG: hypothetical protein SGPRY_009967, partial [Prymnesium sp.]